MRYLVNPKLVRRISMKDGTSYRVPPSGHVTVKPEHDHEMAASPAVGDYHAPIALAMPGGSGRVCAVCGWVGWDWTEKCGRCGDVMS